VKGAFGVALIGLLMLGQSSSAAQTPETVRPPDGGTREVLVSILIPSLPNAPFYAIVNTEWIRQLADGSTITLKNHRAIARDKAGRIFQERRLLVPEGDKQDSIVTQIEISDPIAHKLYICIPSEHVCQLEFFSAHDPAIPPDKAAGANSPARPPGSEDLGPQYIGGLETLGTREERLIEPGTIGNDRPIAVSREYWYSPQLGINLISKRTDPRFGIQNFVLSDIVVADPDAKLFAPPNGSKIIDLREPADGQTSRPVAH
jgi:hypothetical protein